MITIAISSKPSVAVRALNDSLQKYSLSIRQGFEANAVAATVTASAEMIAAEEFLALAATMQKLSPEQQKVIGFRHLDYLSFAQIADKLGESEPAMRMLWIRALRNLQVHSR